MSEAAETYYERELDIFVYELAESISDCLYDSVTRDGVYTYTNMNALFKMMLVEAQRKGYVVLIRTKTDNAGTYPISCQFRITDKMQAFVDMTSL